MPEEELAPFAALAERCRELGVEFKFGYQLKQLEQNGNRITALHFTNGVAVRDHDYVVSTIPLTQLLKTLNKEPSQLPIRFRSMVFVFLEVSMSQLSEYSGFTFPTLIYVFSD